MAHSEAHSPKTLGSPTKTAGPPVSLSGPSVKAGGGRNHSQSRISLPGSERRSGEFTSPQPPSASSTTSDLQLGYLPSDTSGDRVFPIRSVVKVDPSTPSSDGTAGLLSDIGPRSPGIPIHRLGKPRPEKSFDFGRFSPGPSPPSGSPQPSKDRLPQPPRARAFSGSYSRIQADAARKGSAPPLNIEVYLDDAGDDEAGPRGENSSQEGSVDDSETQGKSEHRDSDTPYVATRFRHVETEDGHIIIQGSDGLLQRCEDEPIHIPGAVQGFGVLLAIREEADGKLVVRYASENSDKLLGYTPRQLFSLANFLDILTEEQQGNLLDHIDFIKDEDADPAVDGPEVFSISIRPRGRKRSSKLWCAIHINPAHPELIICEFELDDDRQYPLRPVETASPGDPHDSLHGNPTLEEIERSTEMLSKPLRVLRGARRTRGEQGAMQVFDIMSQVQEQLSSATNLQAFLKVLVGIVKELTGFHRVMMYQFDASFNGRVVAEVVDTTRTVDLYHGLHFPASDIPQQARELYKLNKVRLLYDRELESARIVCRSMEDLTLPLDMSHAYLRAMSPIHLKYLGNMGVRASMSISINAFNDLWGLVACHSYGAHGMRVSFPIRKMCRLVGDTASRNIERLSYASRLQARKLINAAPTEEGNPEGYIIASSEDLLRLFDADFGLLSINDETKFLGEVEQNQEALAMLEYLRMRKMTSVLASQDVGEDFPDLQYSPGFQVLAGLLYVPLSIGGTDFIVFFRKGQVKQVKWAGNPYEKMFEGGTSGHLEPRASFKTWHETVVGKCREWVDEQIETAAVLCLVYGKFIEVWRKKEAALQSNKFRQLLLANSAHEVRTPLNAIINYLEIALEGTLDQETRDNLARSHSASKSLIYVINDLLDLTKAEEGQHLINSEPFELLPCVREGTDPFKIDAERKGIEYEVILHPDLPRFVHGDSRRVRQAILNITANAVAHTAVGFVRVDVFVAEFRDQEAVVEMVVTDSGEGMSAKQVDALFRELEQVGTEELGSTSSSPDSKSSEMGTLGLGLAVVARIVRNMAGQLRIKSEEGQGSRVIIQLPFPLPQGNIDRPRSDEDTPTAPSRDDKVAPGTSFLQDAPEADMLVFDASGISTGVGEARAPVEGQNEAGRVLGIAATRVGHGRDLEAMQGPISPKTIPEARQGSYFGHKEEHINERLRPSEGRRVSGGQEPRKSIQELLEVPASPNVVQKTHASDTRVMREIQASKLDTSSAVTGAEQTSLRVLVAEDDPINMKILKKRLEKAGHEVHHAVNGEDCATMYQRDSSTFDVILMDMQMPIVDGLTSSKMIREVEKSTEHAEHSPLAATYGRVPIFAVSASLVEREYQIYRSAGFDGWILKPIDFTRLRTLLEGIQDTATREECLYTPGHWERGGWFDLST